MVSIDPRYLLTGDVVERPPDERPKHETIEAILDWLAGPAQQIPSLSGAFDEFAWQMLAAGFPLLRATLHTQGIDIGRAFPPLDTWVRISIGSRQVVSRTASDTDNVNCHGQFTLVEQGYPAFRSPYQGD